MKLKNSVFLVLFLVVVTIFVSQSSIVKAQSPDSVANNSSSAKCLVMDMAGAAIFNCTDYTEIPNGSIVDYASNNCYEVTYLVGMAQPEIKLGDCAAAVFKTTPSPTLEYAKEADEKINLGRQEALENCKTADDKCFDNNPIVVMLKFAINFFAGVVGVIVTIVIILAGIQYSSAGGDPGKAASAKKHIYNAILALISFIFLWAFMQWLIPGGIL